MKPIFAQVAGYGVGNTVNLTPAMRAAAQVVGGPVELWLETPELRALFEDADFLDLRVGAPTSPAFLSSSDVLLKPGKPDWLGAYLKVREELGHPGPCPAPYIDRPDARVYDFGEDLAGIPYAVLLRGAASAKWHAKKDPGDEIYLEAARQLTAESWVVCLGGSEQDREWWPAVPPVTLDHRGGGLRRQLALLAGADVVVANDTGLAHAAAAMGKPVFILWKDTDLRKNRAQSPAVTYAGKGHWEPALEEWIEEMIPPGGSSLVQLKIWGLKRSGTNWLRLILGQNFRVRALMDVLGWKHGGPSAAVSWRWPTWYPEWRPDRPPGGPRELSEALEASATGDLRHVCVVKHPLAWLDSMARYEGRNAIGVDWARGMLQKWATRAGQIRAFWMEAPGERRRAVVRYESLLEDLEGALEDLRIRLELERTTVDALDFTKRLERGNDGMAPDACARGGDHDRAYWLEKRYLERIPGKVIRHAKRSLDPELLGFFRYEVGS